MEKFIISGWLRCCRVYERQQVEAIGGLQLRRRRQLDQEADVPQGGTLLEVPGRNYLFEQLVRVNSNCAFKIVVKFNPY